MRGIERHGPIRIGRHADLKNGGNAARGAGYRLDQRGLDLVHNGIQMIVSKQRPSGLSLGIERVLGLDIAHDRVVIGEQRCNRRGESGDVGLDRDLDRGAGLLLQQFSVTPGIA